MNYAVLIASHISYDNQIELLRKAIKSVKNQDYKDGNIDIFLSISFENNKYREEFDNSIISDECFYCYKQDDKTYQLEHLRHLNKIITNEYKNKYEWLLFLDDDDEYANDRISTFNKKQNEILIRDIEEYFNTFIYYEEAKCILQKENGDESDVLDCLIYWCYCIKPIAFNIFFKISSFDSTNNKYGDFLLKCYFEKVFGLNPDATIDDGYYMYNTDNENSISNINDKKESEKQMVYFKTILNDTKYLKKKYGNKYKNFINKKLYNECYKNYNRFEEIEDFEDNFYKLLRKYK
jgi:hypothetical protein